MMPNESFPTQLLVKEKEFLSCCQVFLIKGKLRTSGLCCSLSHLAVHTEMTGNTIERLMKLLYEGVNVVA